MRQHWQGASDTSPRQMMAEEATPEELKAAWNALSKDAPARIPQTVDANADTQQKIAPRDELFTRHKRARPFKR